MAYISVLQETQSSKAFQISVKKRLYFWLRVTAQIWHQVLKTLYKIYLL